jgi:LytS/YehU family sensor histidine kinase
LSRVRLEQQLIESRLATAEAQIDPRMLFEALREIRSSLARAEPQADTQLDRLIRRLRNALARTVVAGESGHATQ